MSALLNRPVRQTDDLHRGRWSHAYARYFITCKARLTDHTLTTPDAARAIQCAWTELERESDITLACATIMPDHVHFLFELGRRLTLGQAIGKFKRNTKLPLLTLGIRWQRDYFEHRLRPDDDSDPIARYIFMNPYRANLIRQTELWPHWRHHPTAEFHFQSLLVAGQFPPDSWLAEDPSWPAHE